MPPDNTFKKRITKSRSAKNRSQTEVNATLSLFHERVWLFQDRTKEVWKPPEYCFERTVSGELGELCEKNSVSSLWHTKNRLKETH